MTDGWKLVPREVISPRNSCPQMILTAVPRANDIVSEKYICKKTGYGIAGEMVDIRDWNTSMTSVTVQITSTEPCELLIPKDPDRSKLISKSRHFYCDIE